ncbi:ATP-binding cassette domain-containing protein [Defluviimonas sp. WL0024]|uniref:ATP-binding cassette domain-containing protein n=1 Tax=Albidovulum salinarum TaxID=2984153 RepID=A0ABT2X4I0_9RHOB|nr:ATP-binding cassette domain-containing protein [Defluviimonas sp. WL0024]MCU9848846.1 ATP-binding cassette domain-containing protein [Defluviimonas sp. WL0024]
MVSPILPLTLDEVELRRQGKRILGPVTYRLEGEGITIVMGPNGAGKTSLLRCMHGLERISRGRMQWRGEADQIRARQAFVFQTPILMRRSVIDCIAYPLILDGLSRREARKAAEREADMVGLKVTLSAPVNVLSGGERQKMALARALIRAPEVLFLDEPCANLDLHSTAEIERVLTGARDRGTRIVMSTHNVGQARRLADDILFLSDGRLIESGSRDAFFAGPGTPEARAHINGDLLP